MNELKLWCYIEGDRSYFNVSILSSQTIYDLQKRIHDERKKHFDRCDAADLILKKIDVDPRDRAIKDLIDAGRYRPTVNNQPLEAIDTISDVWPEQPPNKHLHIFVSLPAGVGSPTLLYDGNVSHVDHLPQYKDIIIKVKNWGKFEHSDIERNHIRDTRNMMTIPNYVTTFEQNLVKKPRLHPDMRTGLQMLDMPESYFEQSEDSTAEAESHEETRYAGLAEVIHTAHHVQLYDWENTRKAENSKKNPLKGHVANMAFFSLFDCTPKNGPVTTLRDTSWPMFVVVKCEGAKKPCKYCPRNDFLISHSSLPRLLVEVNSTPGNEWPDDLIRMFATGAFIVRFANTFVSPFSQEKNFVLCAIFIWETGIATRYTLFQQQNPNDEVVYYNEERLSLNDSAGRVEFVRHLYNLFCVEVDQDRDRDTKLAIDELNRRIKDGGLNSMYTARKHAFTDNCDCTGRGGDDHTPLRAHGLEVKPEVIVDDMGGTWEPLFEMPDHILTVYRPMDPDKEFIAKKVREKSNELEMLRLLDAIPLKSDHVISLIDSFHGWVILPKMTTVQEYVQFFSGRLKSKVFQVCLGLVKGLAYLHEHLIAHRDVKPNNLVVDENFCLKIIDFDIAIRVQYEDDEIDDQRGTEGWMAPEVVKKLRHSPIMADRWACGRVLLFLLNNFGKEENSLRILARNLVARNPKQRPSLLEWCNYPTSLSSDVGNVWNSDADARKAVHPRPDPENAKPPNVKKQRLDGSGQYDSESHAEDFTTSLGKA